MKELILVYKSLVDMLSIIILSIRFMMNIYLDNKLLEDIRIDGIDSSDIMIIMIIIYNYMSMIFLYRSDNRLISKMNRLIGVGWIIVYNVIDMKRIYSGYIILVVIKELIKLMRDMIGLIVVFVINMVINSGILRILIRYGIRSGILDDNMLMSILLNLSKVNVKKYN
jgi:hypothetical protein